MTPQKIARLERIQAYHATLVAQGLAPLPEGNPDIGPAVVPKLRLGHRSLPCIHDEDIVEWCTGCDAINRSVRSCELHERCTRVFVSDKVKACSLCHDYEPGKVPFQWISLAKLQRDTIALAGRLGRAFCGVGGVVRSGMIPASILATVMHLPLWEVGEEGEPRLLRSGNRGRGIQCEGPLLVVDDTCQWGAARKRVRAAMGDRPHKFAVIYCRDGMQGVVDYFVEAVYETHVTEWNWNTNGALEYGWNTDKDRKGAATDLDGILVHDHASGGKPGDPYMATYTHPVPLIVTGRPEHSREATERQLQSLGIRYRTLIMLPNSEPGTDHSIAFFKSRQFASSRAEIFFESEPVQAEIIHRETGRPVFCPRADKVFQKK
jgi:hypothetical protein